MPDCSGWIVSQDGDPRALALADRHYSRGKPGTPLFVGPGRKLVLVTAEEKAVWATRYAQYRADGRQDGWECTIFRNEGPWLSSHLIVLAIGVTRYLWGDPPAAGMFTFIGQHLRGDASWPPGFARTATTRKESCACALTPSGGRRQSSQPGMDSGERR